MMLSEQHFKVVKMIYDKLNITSINWVITGSTAFAVQGVPLIPNDIDMQTDREGAYKIEECFREYSVTRVRLSSNGKMSSHFGCLEIDGVKVEIMGDIQKNIDGIWEEPVDIEKYKRYVMFQNMNLPVLDLKYECEAYMKMGRIEKAEMLKDWVNHE